MELSNLSELNNLVGRRDRLMSWVSSLSQEGGDLRVLVRSEAVTKEALEAARIAILPVYQKQLAEVEAEIEALGVKLN